MKTLRKNVRNQHADLGSLQLKKYVRNTLEIFGSFGMGP